MYTQQADRVAYASTSIGTHPKSVYRLRESACMWDIGVNDVEEAVRVVVDNGCLSK